MKNCTVWGDLSSEKSSENYPEVPVCDDCVEGYKGEEEGIISVNGACDDDFAECYYCEKTKEEEDEEQGGNVDEDDADEDEDEDEDED